MSQTNSVSSTLIQAAFERPIKTYADVLTSTATRPPWVVEGLLLAQTAALVSAHPHGMKSLSWLAACISAPTTGKVWGHFDASKVKRTLFIETEDPEWMVEARIRGLAKGMGIEPGAGFQYWCPGPFDLVGQAKDFAEKIGQAQPDFIVLSTLQNILSSRDMRKQNDMAPVMQIVLAVARHVCPITLITHSPWEAKQRRAVGTVTQTANFMTTMHYKKMVNPKTRETFAHVLLDSKAGAEETSFHLKLTAEGDANDASSVRSVVYGGEGFPRGVGKAAVIAALEDDPDADGKEIAERAGVSQRYVTKLRSELKPSKRKMRRGKAVEDVVIQ